MVDSPLTPPTELPSDLVATLNKCSPDQLRQVAHYAEGLANYREQTATRTEAEEETNLNERSKDRLDGVPTKATITIKTINDNRYYYWQWRDGDTVRSEYKGPVDSRE